MTTCIFCRKQLDEPYLQLEFADGPEDYCVHCANFKGLI